MKTISTVCAIAAMTCSVAAWADKPVEYPGWTEIVTGAFVADCGDFFILNDFRGEIMFERHYFNYDGSVNRMFWRVYWRDSVCYNSNDPSYWLPGISEHEQQWLYFKDGVPVEYSPNGHAGHVNAPGYGPVVFWAGTFVLDLTLGELVFVANPNHSLVSEHNGDDTDAFCAALRP